MRMYYLKKKKTQSILAFLGGFSMALIKDLGNPITINNLKQINNISQ